MPEYQNAQSVIWQLYNGSKHTGYTIHKINKNIDEGDLLYKKKMPIEFEESFSQTVTTTYANVLDQSAIGLYELLTNYQQYENNSTPQKNGTKYTTPSIGEFLRMYKNYKELLNGND